MSSENKCSNRWKHIQSVLSTSSPFSHEEFEESPEVKFYDFAFGPLEISSFYLNAGEFVSEFGFLNLQITLDSPPPGYGSAFGIYVVRGFI